PKTKGNESPDRAVPSQPRQSIDRAGANGRMHAPKPSGDVERTSEDGPVDPASRVRPKNQRANHADNHCRNQCSCDQHRSRTKLALTPPTPCALIKVTPCSSKRALLLRFSG